MIVSPTPSSTLVPPSGHEDRLLDLYAVQKCWYSGPHVTPPVDYLRLLRTEQEAEQIAYHSAHLWAAEGGGGAVRTIVLPAHPSCHAFVAAGHLFWIRRVRALVASRNPSSLGEEDPQAHCIVTQGLLGGGASVRRREEDTAPLRIFVGPQSAHRALQLIASGTGVPPGSTVQWVPVGAPPTVQHIPNEWPAPCSDAQDGILLPLSDRAPGVNDKRTLEENQVNTLWYKSRLPPPPATKNTDPFVAWHPPSPTFSRPHKRPCRPIPSTTWHGVMETADAASHHQAMME